MNEDSGELEKVIRIEQTISICENVYNHLQSLIDVYGLNPDPLTDGQRDYLVRHGIVESYKSGTISYDVLQRLYESKEGILNLQDSLFISGPEEWAECWNDVFNVPEKYGIKDVDLKEVFDKVDGKRFEEAMQRDYTEDKHFEPILEEDIVNGFDSSKLDLEELE